MNGRRILVAGGMLLVFAGLAYAAFYTLFLAPSLAVQRLNSLEMALGMALNGQGEMARGYAREAAALAHRQLVHGLVFGQLLGGGLTALAVSSFIRALALKKKWERILAYLLVLGGAVSAAGFFAQLPGSGFWGAAISGLGFVWQLTGLAGFVIALAMHVIAKPEH